MIDIMMTIYFMKSPTHVLWIFIDGRVLKKFKLCQFPSIESWGYLYLKNIVVCLESESRSQDILSQAMFSRIQSVLWLRKTQ